VSASAGAGVFGCCGFGFARLAFVAATAAASGALLVVSDVEASALKEESAAAADAAFGFLLFAFLAALVRSGGDALEALKLVAARGAGVLISRHGRFFLVARPKGQFDRSRNPKFE